MTKRLQQIDDHSRPDHSFLDENDECYYVLEYTPRQGPHFSETNNLILNLKKSVDRRGKNEYYYKELAIRNAGDMLRSVLNEDWFTRSTLVPVPCSKTRTHPLYDDRMLQVLMRMTKGLSCDIRDMVAQRCDLESFHDGSRLPPSELIKHYCLCQPLCRQRPRDVAVFDDILTTGSHFKAIKRLIQHQWPDVPTCGIFIARRYVPDLSNLV